MTEAVSLIESTPLDSYIIVDFDETLILRNSTEEYLDSIQPRFIAAFLLYLISLFKPWIFLGKVLRIHISQDWIRVFFVTALFPWSPLLWHFKATKIAEKYKNDVLLKALVDRGFHNIIVASNGFSFIIRPILNKLDLSVSKFIACRFWFGALDRASGTKALVERQLGKPSLSKSLCITDSYDDLDLLESVKTPCFVLWPQAEYVRAMTDFYIPLFYTQKVKRPGKNYIIKVLLLEDFVPIALATSWLATNPFLHLLGLTFLITSLWCIYEIGYMENDLIAEKYEDDPKLSDTYMKHKSRISFWLPWPWAIILSVPGILFVKAANEGNKFELISSFSLIRDINFEELYVLAFFWLLVLIAVRLIFMFYNYSNKSMRKWIYPFLQLGRYFSILVVTPTNFVGIMSLLTIIISRWIAYLVYRYSKTWQNIEIALRPLLFVLFIVSVTIGYRNFLALLGWQTGLIFFVFVLKSSREWEKIIASDFGMISRPGLK